MKLFTQESELLQLHVAIVASDENLLMKTLVKLSHTMFYLKELAMQIGSRHRNKLLHKRYLLSTKKKFRC